MVDHEDIGDVDSLGRNTGHREMNKGNEYLLKNIQKTHEQSNVQHGLRG